MIIQRPVGAAGQAHQPAPKVREAPRDRQRMPVPAMFIQRRFPLWNGNQQTSLIKPLVKKVQKLLIIFIWTRT
jgi:hypothetical protein